MLSSSTEETSYTVHIFKGAEIRYIRTDTGRCPLHCMKNWKCSKYVQRDLGLTVDKRETVKHGCAGKGESQTSLSVILMGDTMKGVEGEEEEDVRHPSVCSEYVLLTLVNKETDLAD